MFSEEESDVVEELLPLTFQNSLGEIETYQVVNKKPKLTEDLDNWLYASNGSIEQLEIEAQLTGEKSSNYWNQLQIENWIKLKTALKGPESESMEKLLEMIGLNSIKESFLDLYNRVVMSKKQHVPLDDFNWNALFLGNPGTGKTTVAKLFSTFLSEIGMFNFESQTIMRTGAELIDEGTTGLEDILNELKEDGGGIIFIDEAYQLNNECGRPLINYILGQSERMKGDYGKIVWILAGYKREMEDFLKVNPGLPSRFPRRFFFDDYTDEELELILKGFFDRGGHDVIRTDEKKEKEKLEKQKEKAEKKKQKANANLPPNPFADRYGGAQAMTDKKDSWGNTWKYDYSRGTWSDEYGNSNAYGPHYATTYNQPNYEMGSYNNPIVATATGINWVYNKNSNSWYDRNNQAKISATYPGKPVDPPVEEQKAKKIEPFLVNQPKWIRIAARRVGKRRGMEGFGNAREIKELFNRSLDRQNKRLTNLIKQNKRPKLRMFERDDLLGPKPTLENLKSSQSYQDLLTMEGLPEVKKSMTSMLELVIENAEREEQDGFDAKKKNAGDLMSNINLNRVFLGNPGTGKTTVAELYGKILAGLGILSKGEVILKKASDFIGSALGKSEKVTQAILEESRGSVLVIDEAYGLYQAIGSGGMGNNEPYRDAVINTLVERIQGKPGDDIAVILIGYREEMERMFKYVNPGLSRRFQLDDSFVFTDYTDEALVRILMKDVEKKNMIISEETAVFAIKQLARSRSRPHFGNAGEVKNILSKALMKRRDRMKSRKFAFSSSSSLNEKIELIIDDFKGEDYSEEIISPEKLLENIVGCEEIKKELQRACNLVKYYQQKGKDPKENANFNYLFTGNPGTGKTTIARLMGKMFYSLNLIPTYDVIETTASKFTTGYVGQSGLATREKFKEAKGKVLFIDEAYQLNPVKGGQFMQEVVDEMVQCMTSKDYKNQLIIILAGYEKDILEMLQVNQGLQSRFTKTFHFHDLTVQEIENLIPKKLSEKEEGQISKEAQSQFPSLARDLKNLPNFSNGRDVETLVTKIIDNKINRLHENCSEEILLQDCLLALEEMQKSRPKKTGEAERQVVVPLPVATQSGHQKAPEIRTTTSTTTTTEDAAKKPAAKKKPQDIIELLDSSREDIRMDEEDEHDEEDMKMDEDAWKDVPKGFITALQTILDENDWNNETMIDFLSQSKNLNSTETKEIIEQLSASLGIPTREIEKIFQIWSKNQVKIKNINKLQGELQKKLAKKGKKLALVPIWRCAVCGAADMPYIACYVSPYIVRYDERPLG
jgi:SpoVK/Ycf46/Vps4 family AAA+-type ATPase